MGDDNVLDQNEIERLLGGGGGASAPPPEPAPSADDSSGGVLNQSELDALFGAAGATPTAPAEPVAAGPLGQSDIESLFGSGTPTASTPEKPAEPVIPTMPAMPSSPPPAATRPPAFAAPPMGQGGAGGGFGGPMAPMGYDDGEDDEGGVPRGDIDYLLRRADDTLRSVASEKLDLPTEVIEFQFPEFGGTVPSSEHATLDQISEVELDVKIELGRTNMYLEDVLKLRKGSVVPLEKMAGDAVDIYVNGRLLARGEVLVMNENFCVRVAELLAGAIPME